MPCYPIVSLRDRPDLLDRAADWFHEKWAIPRSAYVESMQESLDAAAVPAWYVVMDSERIIAGIGVIENDFHNRPDLTPNVCAVFVEPAYRGLGIAGQMLSHVCADFAALGIKTLYLLTDHDSFYERYGWEFLCMAQGDGEDKPSRMYIHRT